MHAIASLLPHLSDGIQNYALCALLLSFHNVEKAILNSHSDFILFYFFIFWQMLLNIEFLAAQTVNSEALPFTYSVCY